MKAYNVSFTNAKSGMGRSHKATYKTAVVIAVSAMDAARKAEQFCKEKFPKLHLEEVRLDDDLVID